VHFHEDDLYDCAWDTDFVFDVPASLPSGVYGIRTGKEEQKFAVNVNTRESDLSRFDADALPSQFTRELHTTDDAPSALAGGAGASYFRLLLGAPVSARDAAAFAEIVVEGIRHRPRSASR
jgi:hypothetical protein